MHALHITVEINDKEVKVCIDNLAREDSTELEKAVIDSLEELVAESLKKTAQDVGMELEG